MKKAKKTSSILGNLLIKLAIVLMVLLIGSYAKVRWDFSQNKAYSLSQVSKDAVKTLKDNMVVKLYSSKDLPAQMSASDRYVKDLLEEYKQAGKGKFHYDFITGLTQEELKNKAQLYGIPTMYFQIFENDKTTTKEIIYGLVFEYQGNFESLNILPDMQNQLEYEMTLKIQKIARSSLPDISVYADTLYSVMPKTKYENELNSNYNVHLTDLMTPPQQTPVMIFHAGFDSLTTTQLYNLDQYIMKGGNLVVLADKIASNGERVLEIDSNLFSFLENYGIKFSNAIAMDIFCDSRQMGVDTNISFPIYPVLRGSQHPITKNISNIIIYMGNGIMFNRKPGLKLQTILATSTNSALLEGPDYELDPNLFISPDPKVFTKPPIPLGVIVEGKMESYFAKQTQNQKPGFVPETTKSKIVVFGDRELYIDPDKPIYENRYKIILNAADWIMNRKDMISIRSRQLQESILDIPYYMHKRNLIWGDPAKTELRIKLGINIAATFLPSLILILVGGIMALRRKRNLKKVNEEN
ncbi:MAG: Gldg family protein [Candidatus Cloacimonas sp.]